MQNRDSLHRTVFASLLITLAGGSDLFAFSTGYFSVYPLRVVTLFSAAYYFTLNIQEKKLLRIKSRDILLFIPIAMILYGSVMLFRVDYQNAALKELGNLVFAAGFLFSVNESAKRITDFQSFFKSTLYRPLGFILALSFFEIFTKSHLPSPFASEIIFITDPAHYARLSPAATFGNPNHLAVFLVSAFFVMYADLLENKNKLKPLFFLTLMLIVLGFTLSHSGLMAVCLPLLYLPFHFCGQIQQSINSHKKHWLGVLFLFTGVVLMISLNGGFTGGFFAAEQEEPETPPPPTKKSSLTVRINMLKNGWEMTQETRFLGAGPGQFSELMKTQIQPYETFGYSDAHSGLVEIMSQYGLFILLLWAAWGIFIVLNIRNRLNTRSPYIISAFFMALGFIPISSANSSFLSSPLTWAYLGILNLLVFQGKSGVEKDYAK